MALSNDLLSQFAKATTDNKKVELENVVYGTVVEYEGKNHVRLDGSDMLTPMSSTVSAEPGERVAVRIKNHSATVTGNLSSPASRVGKVEEIDGKTKIYIDSVEGRVLVFDEAHIDKLAAIDGEFINIKAENGNFHKVVTAILEAHDAKFDDLVAGTAEIENLDAKFANIDFANIEEAAFKKIFSDSGLIKDLVVGDQTITGEFVGVTISGDLVKANTLKADKIVVKGSDGLYYKLNVTEGGIAPSEQVTEEDLQNGLHGSNIIAKTITAEKVNVDDLVAFDARLANFTIGLDDAGVGALYSGVKSSIDNTTEGVYLDSDGQMNVGGTSQYLKYYKTEDGSYKLDILASNIRLGTSGKTVEETIDGIKVGGRNLLVDTNTPKSLVHIATWSPSGNYVVEYNDVITMTHETGLVNAHFFYTKDSMLDWLEPNTEYTTSFDIMIDVDATPKVAISNAQGTHMQTNFIPAPTACVANEWTRIEVNLTSVAAIPSDVPLSEQSLYVTFGSAQVSSIMLRNLKLEKGNKASDWTPAPEDMATGDDLENLELNTASRFESSDERFQYLEDALIDLEKTIRMIVTNKDGTSLMTQTEGGWTFCTSELQTAVDNASEALDKLTQESADFKAAIDALQQVVDDHGDTLEYVTFTTYEDEPCIALGESDSEFKLLITNTRIMFMHGSTLLTYINTKGLVTENIEVKSELRQGNFVWAVRANGNYGLTWKEVID